MAKRAQCINFITILLSACRDGIWRGFSKGVSVLTLCLRWILDLKAKCFHMRTSHAAVPSPWSQIVEASRL